MSDGVALEDFEGDPPARDFRRANGAPMVRSLEDPTKWSRYSRPSGWGDDLDEQSALVNWRIDRAMEGVAMDPSIAATVAANINLKEGRQERRERAIQRGRGDEAADIGTALHAMSHRVEANDGFVVPELYAPDIAAYLSELDRAGLDSTYIEVHLCSDEWRAAGTADRIYTATRRLALPSGDWMEPGQSVIGDLKTGQLKDYSIPGYSIQLAIYCDSVFYDVNTNERSPLPDGMRSDWGLIVSMPARTGRCELLWTNLETGRQGARIVRDVRAWRKRNDFVIDFKYPIDDTAAVLDTPMHALEMFHVEHPDPDDPGPIWLGQMVGFALARIETIGTVAEARAALLRQWPSGCGRPNPEMTTGQMTTVLNLLDAVEAAYQIPFPAGDPRRVGGRPAQSRPDPRQRTKEHRTMSNTREANDFLMAEGGKSFPFEKINDVVIGTVVTATVAQQTDLDSGTPLTWADGSPRKQLIITLQTDLHLSDDDDGVRTIYAKGGKYDVETGEGTSMKDALAKAVRDGGGNGIEPGDKVAVAFTGLGVRKNRGFNPPKLYTAQWSRPAASVSARDLFGDMAEPA